MGSPRRLATLTGPAALAAIGFAFVLAPLVRGEIFFFWDNARLHFPLTVAIHDALRAGAFLEWSPWGAGGFPTVGEGNAGLFHPVRLLFAWLLPPPAAFMLELGLYLALTGVATYAFVRTLGAGGLAATFAGLTNMLGGFSVVSIKNIAHMRSLWVLPLMLLLAERFAAGSHRTLQVLLAGLLFAVQFLTGNPHIAVITAIASTLYVAFRTWQRSWDSNEPFRSAIWRLIAAPLLWSPALLIGAAIGAIQVVPQMVHTAESTRAGGMNFDFAMELSASVRYLGQLILPYAYDQSFQFGATDVRDFNETSYRGIYMGMVPAVLCAVALFQRRRVSTPVPVLIALALTGVVLALGSLTPLYPALWSLPVLGSLRFPFRFLAIPATCVACLAGVSLAQVIDRQTASSEPRVTWRELVPMAGILGAAGIIAVYLSTSSPEWLSLAPDLTRGVGVSLLLLAVACVLVLAAIVARGRGGAIAVAALIVFTAADLWWFRERSGYAPPAPVAEVMAPPPIAAFLQRDPDVFRIMSLERWEEAGPRLDTIFGLLQAHATGLWRIESADPYESLMLRRWFIVHAALGWEFLNDPDAPAKLQQYVGALNVKYMLAPPSLTLTGWEPVHETASARTWRNPAWMPRAFLVNQVIPERLDERAEWLDRARQRQGRYPDMIRDWSTRAAESQIVDTILHDRVDFATTAVMEGSEFPELGGTDPNQSVIIGPRGVNEMRFDVKTAVPAVLVIASNFYPGWTATINGAPTPIHRTNWVASGVFVPAGGGDVVLRFSTPGLRGGAVVSLLSLVVVVALLIRIRRRWPASITSTGAVDVA